MSRMTVALLTMGLLATSASSHPAWAAGTSAGVDFSQPDDYATNFRDVVNGGGINQGTDLAGGSHNSLNFTGSAPIGGRSWVTIFDTTPADATEQNLYSGTYCLSADILSHRFNNAKGAGFVTLFSDGPTGSGLAVLLINAGNTDRLALYRVNADGSLQFLAPASTPLHNAISEDRWYHLQVQVTVGTPTADDARIDAAVFAHTDPTDPNSDVSSAPLGTLAYTFTLSGHRVQSPSEVGLITAGWGSVADSSITNFNIEGNGCDTGVPPTGNSNT